MMNEDGKIELKQVTDGTYSAEGTLKNLTIIKGPVDKLVEHKLDVKININFLSKSIVVTVDLVGEGIPVKYKYMIEGPDGYTETITKEVGKNETPESHTFDNLTIGEEYTVKVYVTNSTGKTTKEETKTGKTIDPIPTITLTPTGKTYETSDKTYMTSGKVIIEYTKDTNEGLSNGYKWCTKEEIESDEDECINKEFIPVTGEKVEIEAQNNTIIAAVLDGEEIVTSNQMSINNIDTEGPEITEIAKNGLTVTITASDTDSGLHNKAYKCGNQGWKANNVCEFEEEGTYTIIVRDALENPTTTNVTVQLFDENNGAEPVFGNLTPVVYDEENSTWKVVSRTDTSWSDYEHQKWGNAVLLKGDLDEPKEVGDPVTVEGNNPDVVAMFVWIPRYEYKIEGTYGTHYNSDGTKKSDGTKTLPGEIEVKFISSEQTEADSGYIIHPAFTFGDDELDGIWVGKFETTGTTSAPTILPSVISLSAQTINVFRITAQKFVVSGYDSHMAKNSEWGAAAYLSQSRYGKYGNPNYEDAEKQVRINNCNSGTDGIPKAKTGIGANSQNQAKSTSTCTTNTYETANGQTASTTGNITGIYDMSGGANEYVMGVLNTTPANSEIDFSTIETKYYDNYTTETSTTSCDGICYGHALSETSGWYSDTATFVSSTVPWFTRGGYSGTTSGAGVFGFSHYYGYGNYSSSFRVVLSKTN